MGGGGGGIQRDVIFGNIIMYVLSIHMMYPNIPQATLTED